MSRFGELWPDQNFSACCQADTRFSRSLCPEPCGMMHYICEDCGNPDEECEWGNGSNADREDQPSD